MKELVDRLSSIRWGYHVQLWEENEITYGEYEISLGDHWEIGIDLYE